MDTQFFAQLRDCLAQLYPSDGDAVRVAHDTGIDSARVATDESAVNRWHAILMEAEKMSAIERLFEIALKDYGRHELLRALYLIYQQQQAHSTPYERVPVEMLATLPLPHTWPARHSPRRLVKARVPERIVIALLLLLFFLFNFDTIQSAAGSVRTLFLTVVDSSNGAVITTRLVESPVISPDNTRMAMVSQDGAVVLTDLITGQELTKMQYEAAVTDLFFIQDGTRLIIIVGNDTTHIWDSQSGEKLSSLHHDALVTKTSLSADGTQLLATTADGMTQTWNLESGELIASGLESELIQPSPVHIDADQLTARVIVNERPTSGDDAIASFVAYEPPTLLQRRWDSLARTRLYITAQGGMNAFADGIDTQLITHLQNNRALTKFDVSPDRTRLATVEQWSNTVSLIRLWNSRTGKQLASFSYEIKVTQVLFSPDSSYLGVAGDTLEADTHTSTIVYIVESAKGNQVSVLRPKTPIEQLCFSPDGSQLATATPEGTVELWQISSGRLNLQFTHHAPVTKMLFRADGARLVTITADKAKHNNIYLWDTTTGREVQRFVDVIGLERVGFKENDTQLIVIAESRIRND